jgi:hypothetical protein
MLGYVGASQNGFNTKYNLPKKVKNCWYKNCSPSNIQVEFLWNVQKKIFSTFGIFVVGLAFIGKDIVSRFILMYSSRLMDFIP